MSPRTGKVIELDGVRDKILDALSEGMSFESAAAVVGVDRRTLHRWRVADPDFNAQCMSKLAEFERGLVGHLKCIAADEPSAAQWLLERRFPWKWSKDPQFRMAQNIDRDELAEPELAESEVDMDALTEAAKKR